MRTIGLAITLAVMLSTHVHALDSSGDRLCGAGWSDASRPVATRAPDMPPDAVVSMPGGPIAAAGRDRRAGQAAAIARAPAGTAS